MVREEAELPEETLGEKTLNKYNGSKYFKRIGSLKEDLIFPQARRGYILYDLRTFNEILCPHPQGSQ